MKRILVTGLGVIVLLMGVLLLQASSGGPGATYAAGTCTATGTETVATDKADYSPEETVHITGTGYNPSCDVVVKVTRPDGSVVTGDGTFTPGSDTVTTGADGSLPYDYILDGVAGTYTIDVLGTDSQTLASDVMLASTTFLDATRTWNGSVSTEWNTAGNWTGGIPGSGDDVTIPAGLTNYPVVSTAAANAKTITMSGAGTPPTLTVSANTLTVAGNITVTTGSITVSGGTIAQTAGTATTVGGAGTLSISAGSYNAGAQAINAIISGATLSVSGGSLTTTVKLDVSTAGVTASQSGGTIDVKDFDATGNTFNQSGSTSLFKISHDLKGGFNSTGGTIEFTGSDGGGGFPAGTYQFFNVQIDAGVTETFDNAVVTINVRGNWTNNGAATLTGAATTVTFNGTATQTIGGTASTTFNNLIVNNSAGLTLGGSVNQTVSGTLTFTSGNITTGSNTLIANGTVVHTSGHVVGNLQKPVAIGAPLTRTFEVGTGANYTPLTFSATITGTSGTPTLTVSTTASDHPSISSSGLNPSRDANRYWTITRAGTFTIGAAGYTVGATYVSGDVDPGATPSAFVMREFTSPSTWGSPTSSTFTASFTTTGNGFGLGTLAAGAHDFAVGETGTATSTISGKVVNDANGNGVDNTEAGLSGVTVSLYRDTNANGVYDSGTDALVTSTTSAGDGTFSFGTLFADTYFVIETDPSGYTSTNAIAGTNGAIKIDNNTIKVVLVNGTTSSGNEFLDVAQTSAINVAKSSPTTSVTAAGQVVTYTFTVTNTGNQTLTGITVSDPKCTSAISGPSGDANSDGKLQTTETWIYTCTHTVTQAEIDAGGNLSNTVTADSNETAPTTDTKNIPITNNATATLKVSKVYSDGNTTAVTVSVSCTSGSVTPASASVAPGSPATFTVTGFATGTTCTASEGAAPASYVKDQSNCAALPVVGGGATSCTIINGAVPAECSGMTFDHVILGTAGPDNLTGTPQRDLIFGLGGDDVINGGGPAADCIVGGDGNDTIYGGPGDDVILGGSGSDFIEGGPGNDTIYGGDEVGVGDTIDGGPGDDRIFGGGGDDLIHGGDGNDMISGGAGNDTIYGDNGNDIVDGGDGNDIIYGGNGNDTMCGGFGNDSLYGDNGNDTLYGDQGNDSLNGGNGSDTMVGGDGTGDTFAVDKSDTVTQDGVNGTCPVS